MYYVYVIKSKTKQDKFYTGFSENLKQRIDEHNSGKLKHTCKNKPWELVFYGCFVSKKLALDFEKYLKSGSGVGFRNRRLIFLK